MLESSSDAPTVVLGREGLLLGLAAIVAELLLIGLVVALGGLAAVGYPLLLLLGTAGLLLFNYNSVVRLEDDALVVVKRGRRRRYSWSEVLEVSWRHEGGWGGSGPVLRTRGGPYDQPGPNLPDQIAQLPIFGRAAGRRAVAALRNAAGQHGVPYSETMERDIALGRRRPRLPTDSD